MPFHDHPVFTDVSFQRFTYLSSCCWELTQVIDYTPDHDIPSLKNGMLVDPNKHLSLLSFRLAHLLILRTLLSVASWSLPMLLNTAMRMSSVLQNTFGSPWCNLSIFAEIYLQPVPHQMAVICIYIYHKDKKRLLIMMNAHLALGEVPWACFNEHVLFNTCQPG